MAPSEQEREELVQMLMSLQTGCDEKFARHILQKYDWDADRAAAALLDMPTSMEQVKKTDPGSDDMEIHSSVDHLMSLGALNVLNPAPARPNSVIDLTGDEDEETAKAIEASMESQAVFGPSNRIDDTQSWAMVPSNAPPKLSQEDQALNRALEASLSSSFVGAAQEPYEEPSDPSERVRKDGRPVAFRTTNATQIHVPVVLQCLLSIPRVCDRLLRYDMDSPGDEEVHAFAKQFQRLAAVYIHTARSYVAVDDVLDSPSTSLSAVNHEPLSELTRDFYSDIANQLELIPRNPEGEPPDMSLMVFQGANATADVNEASSSYASGFYIEVNVPSSFGNDLPSVLSHSFSNTGVCLTQLSECIAFVVRRQDDVGQSGSGTERVPLSYPSRIYLDRFMQDNVERATELRNYQESIQHEIQKLITDRSKLSNWKNKDTLKALRSSVHYFEHLASDGGDPERKLAQEQIKLKLLGTIKQLETDLQSLGSHIKELTADVEALFDKPDLQRHGYDLHAVIMHDGLLGRNHIYSYTKDDKDKWWKIVDSQVSEVTEDMVLSDRTGLHLGAGPLVLFYTYSDLIDPALVEKKESHLPRFVKDLVEQDNETFWADLRNYLDGLPSDIVDTFNSSFPEVFGAEAATGSGTERGSQDEVPLGERLEVKVSVQTTTTIE